MIIALRFRRRRNEFFMKKSKLTLALVASFSAVMALSACNDVTAKDGVVLTFTDNSGRRVEYRASDLLDNYEQGSSAASTNFNKVKEVLIRKYYETNSTVLEQLKTSAQNSVDSIKKQAQSNADSNGTSYATELETLLNSNNVSNVSELFEAKLYEEEEKDFERQFKNAEAIEAMKTGKDAKGNAYFPSSEEYGRGSNGYLIEKTPYHVSHFLVKFTSSSHSEACQFTITKDESLKISQAVKAFAGATNSEDGATKSDNRQSFGQICYTLPSDDTSATDYGNLGLMESGYVSEFRLGVYAYDALYNQKHTASDSYACSIQDIANNKDDTTVREYVLPSEDDTFGPDAKNTRDYFEKLGIGTIPYGAAVALGYGSVASDPNLGYSVNDGDATYYARNVLFNKYFNNRSIAVIVPEEIPFNGSYEDGSYEAGVNMSESEAETFVAKEKANYDDNGGWYRGTYSANYASLPGFSVDTSDILDIKDSTGAQSENVLTNERGQIILAVKASNSSGNAYEGIHFIVVNRSALDAYVKYDASAPAGKSRYTAYNTVKEAELDGYSTENGKSTSDITSLSEYFTVETPNSTDFPKYADSKEKKSTFVNRVTTTDTKYQENAEKISTAIKNYNSSQDTFEFQQLMESKGLVFSDSPLGKKIEGLVKDYISATREKNYEDEIKTLDDTWDTYAEALERQNEDRDIADGKQRLISEAVAITYCGSNAQQGTEMYDAGGIGYDGKK